jgi:hypothetical protein
MAVLDNISNEILVALPIADKEVRMILAVLYLLLGAYQLFLHGRSLGATVLGSFLLATGVIIFGIALSKIVLSVTSQALVVTISILGLQWNRQIPLSEVANLRVCQRQLFARRWWLAFDRLGKRKFIGLPLQPWTADSKFLRPIYAASPQLMPQRASK